MIILHLITHRNPPLGYGRTENSREAMAQIFAFGRRIRLHGAENGA